MRSLTPLGRSASHAYDLTGVAMVPSIPLTCFVLHEARLPLRRHAHVAEGRGTRRVDQLYRITNTDVIRRLPP